MEPNPIESVIEKVIFQSRWLLAPIYLGLVCSLAVLMVKFVQGFLHMLPHVLEWTDDQVVVGVLELVDLSLAGNLLLMVIFAGYENFVSKINTANNEDRPSWMGTVDFSGLKLKLIASIVAISGIHILKLFMEIHEVDKGELFWLLVIHGTFVVSGLLLAVMDRVAERHATPR